MKTQPNPAGRHLVLAGGGHVHLTTLKHLDRITGAGHAVTVISPGEYHYYSGMGPGMLSGIYRPDEARFHIRKMVEDRGGRFLPDRVVRVEPDRRTLHLESGGTVDYDVVSFNTGSGVPFDVPEPLRNERVFPVKPVQNLLRAQEKIVKALRERPLKLVIAGGGPAGVEVAGNLVRLVTENGGRARILLFPGASLLSGVPERIKNHARINLRRREVEIADGIRVAQVTEEGVLLSDGTRQAADFVFMAVGVQPSPLFRDSGLPVGDSGGLLVNEYLQCVDYPEIFGGGDCIDFAPQPLARVGVYAVRENPVLFQNLSAAVNGENSMEKFEPQNSFLLILNMGNGTGIAWKDRLAWRGWLAFRFKDYIDRKFMRRFQVSGERG